MLDSLEPRYSTQFTDAITKVEDDPARVELWNAICDAVDLVCDRYHDSAEVRREQVRTSQGVLHQIPIRCHTEDDDWVLLWHQVGHMAVFEYVGSRLFR